ncbi:hypothetical protein HYW55_05180 [Candidatus Gottesmanbacteria bacterium]|nr:hypothetical protein [Candidatus Gottesmanbacteria bacterium]
MTPENFNIYWLLPFVVIDLLFKGIALWRAARHNQRNWFIALLILNSAGILPIIYLTLFERKDAKQ